MTWESAAATQANKEFGLEGIPYLRVYSPKGELLGEVSGANIQGVENAVRKGLP